MKRAMWGIALLLAQDAVAQGIGSLYLSWSADEYVDHLEVRADTTATCYVLVDVGDVEFVGYHYDMIMTEGVDIIGHEAILQSGVYEITSPDSIEYGISEIVLEYSDCPAIDGLTSVGLFTVNIDADFIHENPGTYGFTPLDLTFAPEFSINLFPDDCGALASVQPFDQWNGVVITYAMTPVEISTWSDIKRLFED